MDLTATFIAQQQVPPNYDLVVEIFDNSGQKVATVYQGQVVGPPSEIQLTVNPFFANGQDKTVISSSNGDFFTTWDGRDVEGNLVDPGVYYVQARWADLVNPVEEIRETSMTLLRGDEGILSSMVLAPNPVGSVPGQSVRLSWQPQPKVASVEGRIYNLAGELILTVRVSGQQGFVAWDTRTHKGEMVSNGTYVWAVEIRGWTGELLERGTLKMVVLRK